MATALPQEFFDVFTFNFPADMGGASYLLTDVYPLSGNRMLVIIWVSGTAGATSHSVAVNLLSVHPTTGVPTLLDSVFLLADCQYGAQSSTHIASGLLWAFAAQRQGGGNRMNVQGLRVGATTLTALPQIDEGFESYSSNGYVNRPLTVFPSGKCISMGTSIDGITASRYHLLTYDLDAGSFSHVAGPPVSDFYLRAGLNLVFAHQGLLREGGNITDSIGGVLFQSTQLPAGDTSLDLWRVDESFNFTHGVHLANGETFSAHAVVGGAMYYHVNTSPSALTKLATPTTEVVWPGPTEPVPSANGVVEITYPAPDFTPTFLEVGVPGLSALGASYTTPFGFTPSAWVDGAPQYVLAVADSATGAGFMAIYGLPVVALISRANPAGIRAAKDSTRHTHHHSTAVAAPPIVST